jgi:hypothetical protein
MWGALSDERTGLSFTIAAGPCQSSLSRVRVPWDSRPYFTVSDSRLPFSSPPTTRRVTVEVFDTASIRVGRSVHVASERITFKTPLKTVHPLLSAGRFLVTALVSFVSRSLTSNGFPDATISLIVILMLMCHILFTFQIDDFQESFLPIFLSSYLPLFTHIHRAYYEYFAGFSFISGLCWALASSSVSFSFLHRRSDSLDGVSARRKAAAYTQENTKTA